MKTILKNIITSRAVIWTFIGCLLFLGALQLFVVKGCNNNNVGIVSDVLHPYTSEEILNSRVPVELPPFPEPSLEGLVEQLKAELGVTDAETAADADLIAKERELDNLNFMDSRRDLAARQAAWEQRKRQVIANPELLWTPGFVLPPTLDVMELSDKSLYNYKVRQDHEFTITQEQQQRIYDVRDQAQRGEISSEESRREAGKIRVEMLDPLNAAKYFLTYSSVGSVNAELGIEYAERAIQKNPDFFEAHHVWTLCNRMFYLGTDDEKVVEGHRNLADRYPNSSIALQELGETLLFAIPLTPHAEEALGYVQRAIQLDDRIEQNNVFLAKCYHQLGEYEKALAVYQGMSEVHYGHGGGLLTPIYALQREVYKQRQQQTE